MPTVTTPKITTPKITTPKTTVAAPAAQLANRQGRSADRLTQTVTSIISANTNVQSGDVLYSVDGSPIVALDGKLPAWRSLSVGSKDGPDIKQLELSLSALGFDLSHKATVNEHFDSATQTMVKAWQTSIGVSATGTIPLGTVVFLPTTSTVTTVSQKVGAKVGDGDAVLTLAAATQNVVISVPAGDQAQVVTGLKVQIGQVSGQVAQLRSASQNGTTVVQAVIVPEKPLAQASAGSNVKVTLTLVKVKGALLVPAGALVSRLDGSYAVQVGSMLSNARWQTVKLIAVSGGTAAISGDSLDATTSVLLPV
jgi:peptidoglycan hydrolase-like protein with peptidoglycan-binding domain